MKSLSDFEIKEVGVIREINEAKMLNHKEFLEGDVEDKLLEIGFIEGATVEVLHKGFFGNQPIAVRINNNNTLISLRRNEASAIIVEESTK